MRIQLPEKKHLSANGLLREARAYFNKVSTPSKTGSGRNIEISLADCLMSGLAVFAMKYPSLLQFDNALNEKLLRYNLKTLYNVEKAPCDTQLRTRLDVVDPSQIRGVYKKIFSFVQRGKFLERYQFIDGHYLLLSDGTGLFSSKTVHCENCCVKNHRDGSKTYYHQMLAAAIVHPDYREVIPICPEPIRKGDGATKNDCERNASKRLLNDLRREHPHLPLILVEDALASNAPHLRLCQKLNIRFITVVKEKGNKTLFNWLKGIKREQKDFYDDKGNPTYQVEFCNGIPLNDADPDLEVNFIECWGLDKKGNKKYHNTWVTDIPITKENVLSIVRGGRARWKIENETFNTLKNQGYKFEHNYGHGNKNLNTIFAMLMLLAFLIDQIQQMCCHLFQAALSRYHAKIVFWERLRNTFDSFRVSSWRILYQALAEGVQGEFIFDSS